jgi:thioredoxin-related protein
MKSSLLFAFLLLYFLPSVNAQSANGSSAQGNEVKWYSFEEGMKLAKKKHKYVIVDIYTDWCGWCKKMDNETFRDPSVVNYLNESFVAIKLNAEEKNAIAFNGNIYTNPKPALQRSTHQLAVLLAGSRLAYPTYIYLDSKGKTITSSQGYMQPEDLLPLLKYVGSEAYKTKTWKEFTGLN